MTNPSDEIDAHLVALKAAVQAGTAICLLGAGFSRGAVDSQGKPLPSTEVLSDEIKKLLNIPESEKISLADAAEYANETFDGAEKLSIHLIQRLTGCSPSREQIEFLSMRWRAIFTTNFDDVVEKTSVTGRVPVSPQSMASAIEADSTPIYYMHGRARDLVSAGSSAGLVISESNYLALSQKNRDLYAKLFNEIVAARHIIIVGYSIKDLEIAAGILRGGDEIRNKTTIIVGPEDSDFSISRLAKFGSVYRGGLGALLADLAKVGVDDVSTESFQFLNELLPVLGVDAVESEDVIRMILTGDVDRSKYVRQKSSPSDPYCITRKHAIDGVLNSGVQRFLISSDFGNGKTNFLSQVAVELMGRGYRVFSIETHLSEIYDEIESALRLSSPIAFLIDDVVRYRSVAIFIGARLNSHGMLICTTRGDSDSVFEKIANQFGGAYRHIDLNQLDDVEVDGWDALLERWGLWETRAGVNEERRKAFLIENCGREVRSIILSLFKESAIAKTIDDVVNFFLKTRSHHAKAFAGILISSLCQKHVSWSSVVNWLEIDEGELKRDIESSEINFLFCRGRNWNLFTSSQLADYVLRTRFLDVDRDQLVSVYTEIVIRTASSANDQALGIDFNENLKELMKYRFLTRLFGDSDASAKLIGQVYKRLSSHPRIRENPQFWLQFAMSRMGVNDLTAAETYIATALAKAEARGKTYSPFQILDQRARLYLKKNAERDDAYSTSEIRVAIRDLITLTKNDEFDVVYTMRSVPIVLEFVEQHVDRLDADNKAAIVELARQLSNRSSDYDSFPRAQKGESKVLKKALSDVKLVLSNA